MSRQLSWPRVAYLVFMSALSIEVFLVALAGVDALQPHTPWPVRALFGSLVLAYVCYWIYTRSRFVYKARRGQL